MIRWIFAALCITTPLLAEAPQGYSEALGLYGQGKYEESLAKVRSIFDANRGSLHIRMLAAANHARMGRFQDAATHLQYAVKDHPDSAPAFAMLAAVYRRTGNFGDAQALIGKAVALDGKNLDYRMESARIYYKSGAYAQARRVIGEILAQQSTHQEALALEGIILLQQGDAETAAFRLRHALMQKGGSKAFVSDIYNNMAVALRKNAEALDKAGNPAEAAARRTEAVEMLAKALELNPNNPQARANKNAN